MAIAWPAIDVTHRLLVDKATQAGLKAMIATH